MPTLPVRGHNLPDAAALAQTLGGLSHQAPVVVMIHGFGYDPSDPAGDPHLHILALRPARRWWGAVSWPRRLGLVDREGLGVAWGWPARGTIWAANAQAAAEGRRLAGFVKALRAGSGERPVHVIAHSLGARVVIAAMGHLGPGDIQRVILLAPALSSVEARRACRSPAGRTAEFVNVTGRENRLFDLLLLLALPHQGRRLGRKSVDARNWLELPLDNPGTREALARLGWRIPPSRAKVCHWSGYLRPGVWRLYRDLLLRPSETPLSWLSGASRVPPPAGAPGQDGRIQGRAAGPAPHRRAPAPEPAPALNRSGPVPYAAHAVAQHPASRPG